ncbi:hypothetical protein BJ875DRAFT_457367 [Amylocarpus encephaloides]|uniref:Secreted protein n=1 Tax=Amylocarpus encephaloides TaxID=45428 RepID=A0A9P7YM56_9HELO|nr:hypothetical protein BJ875DRAFT_457367 [Amylocarpus encephaloides]
MLSDQSLILKCSAFLLLFTPPTTLSPWFTSLIPPMSFESTGNIAAPSLIPVMQSLFRAIALPAPRVEFCGSSQPLLISYRETSSELWHHVL